MKIPPDFLFPAVGKCIYCGTDSRPLTPEHVIPFSFGGHYILPAASCRDCAEMTGADEGRCCHSMFRALRVHHRFPTRRPRKRPTTLPVIEGKTRRDVPVSEAPGIVTFPILPPPQILLGLPPSNSLQLAGFGVWTTTEDATHRTKKLLANGFMRAHAYTEIPCGQFLRTLAKIAHGYDVANVGITNSDDTLNAYILRKDDRLSYLIGGTEINSPIPLVVPLPSESSGFHQVCPFAILLDGVGYIGVQIRLFTHLRPLTPVYSVIMRQRQIPEGDPYFTINTKK